jgi:NAD(P)-dependent dehydrogenase (short-subunit alcohol dehydrogenase family)
MMDDNFKGQVALVTGAAVGMGFATAKAFAEAGAAVALVDVNQGAAECAADQLGPVRSQGTGDPLERRRGGRRCCHGRTDCRNVWTARCGLQQRGYSVTGRGNC